MPDLSIHSTTAGVALEGLGWIERRIAVLESRTAEAAVTLGCHIVSGENGHDHAECLQGFADDARSHILTCPKTSPDPRGSAAGAGIDVVSERLTKDGMKT